jgi:hypothetical protein
MGRPASDKKAGRPFKDIDWDIVDNLLIAQCTAKEIAGHFDMHEDTFYYRVKEKHSMNYTEYAASKQSKGKGLLRTSQFKKAMSGNPQLLVWLGKQYLQQKDGNEVSIPIEEINRMQAFFDMLKGAQVSPTFTEESSDLNNEDNNTSSE